MTDTAWKQGQRFPPEHTSDERGDTAPSTVDNNAHTYTHTATLLDNTLHSYTAKHTHTLAHTHTNTFLRAYQVSAWSPQLVIDSTAKLAPFSNGPDP